MCPNASGFGQGALRALCSPRLPGCAPKTEPHPCVGAPLPRRGSARARAHPTLALSLSLSLSLSPGPGHCAHRSGSRPPLQRGARVPACTSPIFCPMCLTARNGSRGGRLERTQGEHPHVLGLRVTARGRSPATLLLSPCYPPSEHANSTPSRRGRSGLWRRRAVRAPVGDAAAPSRRATRSKDAGRRAGRSSSPAGSCLSAMGGAAARGTCAACAARARLWPRASTTRDGPVPQARTAPHRSADASRSVPIAGGEVELALRSGAQQGTLPA